MLTVEQLRFFARNGFLHVKDVIDAKSCQELVAHTWTRLPSTWSPEDPGTWSGVAEDSCHVADLKTRRGLFQFQKGDLLGDPVVERAFSLNAPGGQLGLDLLGYPLAKMKVRGLYCIAPLGPDIKYSPAKKPHIESHAAQLIALCYLADVQPGAGGLLVWPGSHKDLYPAMGSKLEYARTPEYDAAFRRWSQLDPVELPGGRGDIVIIHHRLLHAPSLNRSRKIRFAFLCDYKRVDFLKLCTELPSSSDLWEDWPAIARLPPEARNAPSDFHLKPQGHRSGRTEAPRREYISDPHATSTASSIKKADASVLARARKDGDIWIALSDDPITRSDTEIFPRGSDLTAAGVVVTWNGKAVTPVCKYDIISRIAPIGGEHLLHVLNLDRRAWLRVLRVRLPFRQTEILATKEVSPGNAALPFGI